MSYPKYQLGAFGEKIPTHEGVAATAPEIARLRAILDQAVTELCAFAEDEQATGHQETADRIWGIANEYLETQVQHGR